MKLIRYLTIPLLVTVFNLPVLAEATSNKQPPNVVLLFADDLGYGDLGCYGNPVIRTPQLDSLAREGLRFTSFYSAAPACTPSRAALLTGRYAVRVGLPHVLSPESTNGIPAGEITLAEALKEGGYKTAAIGKWHIGHASRDFLPTRNGFDSYLGLLYSNDMMPPWVQTEQPIELWRNEQPIESPVDQDSLTSRYTEEAVRFIKESEGDPFFLYLAYSMPHVPLHTADQFKGRSRGGLYGDIIEAIDASVGRILSALADEGITQNTIVIFTSDNGPWLNMPARMFSEGKVRPWDAGSPGPLRGWKGTTFEGGFRVPCLIRWPGVVQPDTVTADPASTMDLFPTLVSAASRPVPSDREIDGIDLRPFLSGPKAFPVRPFYYFNGAALDGVRQGPWKLLRVRDESGGNAAFQLFNLDVDPGERYNRADEHPDVVSELTELIAGFKVRAATRP